MFIAFERYRYTMELPFPLDVDILRAVDHDFCHGIIFQQGLKRTKTEDFGRDLLEKPSTLRSRKNDVLLVQYLFVQVLDRPADLLRFRNIHRGIQFGQQLILNARFQVEIGTGLRSGIRRADAASLEGSQARSFTARLRWGA